MLTVLKTKPEILHKFVKKYIKYQCMAIHFKVFFMIWNKFTVLYGIFRNISTWNAKFVITMLPEDT